MAEPKKIAILGGGPSALSTAFHLTSIPNWQRFYRITFYQMGWRLGGKCASSRNEDANYRIEEHGIHLFGNFYANTFAMLRDVYAEVQWEQDEPFTTIDEAFKPDNYAYLTDFHDDRWFGHDVWLPHNDGKPWEHDDVPSAHDLIDELIGTLYALLTSHELPEGKSDHGGVSGWLKRMADKLGLSHSDDGGHVMQLVINTLKHLSKAHQDARHPGLLDDLLEGLEHLVEWLLKHAADRTDRMRWLYVQMDFYSAMMRGVIADDLINRDIDDLDHEDYRAWLRRHGASELTLNSSLVANVANVCFQFPDGNTFKPPSMSTAAFLSFALRQLMARGAAAYFFAAGTGETIIAPLYRVLKQRGVEFRFFHKVSAVNPSQDGKSIDSFECEIQATLKSNGGRVDGPQEYQPLTRFKNLFGWPANPDYGQLVQGDAMASAGADLESYWSAWEPVESKSYSREAGDFDHVVLGLSIGALPSVCPKLSATHNWKKMIDALQAIPTQQYQLWLDKPISELGWDPKAHGLHGTNRLITASYQQPAPDVGDFSDLLRWEGWPENGRPQTILYFCGPMQPEQPTPPFSDHEFPSRQHTRVKSTAVQYMRNLSDLLDPPGDSPALDPNDLVCFDPAQAGVGEMRFAQQFFRANIDPTERYVLSPPGSASARLAAWESGFENLVLCGDWTFNGLNVGSVEGSVMSGMLACCALTGLPATTDILGYHFLRPDPRRPTAPQIPIS